MGSPREAGKPIQLNNSAFANFGPLTPPKEKRGFVNLITIPGAGGGNKKMGLEKKGVLKKKGFLGGIWGE